MIGKPKEQPRSTRRKFLLGAGALGVSAFLVDGFEIDRHHLEVEHYTAPIRNLGPGFDGFRIAQISDFHHRAYGEDYFLREVVRRVNALKPDMVALTGDFITAMWNSVPVIRYRCAICAEILSELKAPLRFCSLGNHDAIDVPGVTAILQGKNLPVLHNSYVSVDRGGDRLLVAGIADAYYDVPDLARAVPKRKQGAGAPVLLLGHEPDFADTVRSYGGVDLMLAGHTHGGQIDIPLLVNTALPDMGRKYVKGGFRLGELQLYVNRGIGSVHVPFRFRSPPEITLITLKPA